MQTCALLDASVLVPASPRDTLLRAAHQGLYKMRITEDIMGEVKRSLVKQRGITEEKAQHLIDKVTESFLEAFVVQYESLIVSMPNHEKDRHVLAAAVICRAQIIVTQNVRHFSQECLAPFGIEAQTLDEFLVHLVHLAPEQMVQIVTMQAEDLRDPPMSVLELLGKLERHAPTFVQSVLEILDR